MRTAVPSTAAHNEYTPFPKGYYNGEISGAEIRDPSGDGSWLVLRVQHAEIAPNEGTNDPGRKRFSGDITIQTDGINALEVDYDSELPFQIQKAQELLAGLAEGLGVHEEVDGNIVFDSEELVEALVDGAFEGRRVSFEVSHWESNNGVRDQVNQYGPA